MYSMWEHFMEVCGSIVNDSKVDCDPYTSAEYVMNNDNMNFKKALFKMTEAPHAESKRVPFGNIAKETRIKKFKSSLYENCEKNRHLSRTRLPIFIELAGREDN